jgi:ferric-dicitrate binding protein FerR (iron transport regulator)
MEEEGIRRLINNFLADEISSDEIDHLKAWLEESPENRRFFDSENELWQKTDYKTAFEHFEAGEVWSEISRHFSGTSRRSGRAVTLTRRNLTLLMTAASIALLMAIGGLTLWISEGKAYRQGNALTSIIRTAEGEKANILLPDSSQIMINSGSEIEYSANYNITERTIRLSGEAFFDVHTDPDKPFIVQAGKEMKVCATGTKFNIYSYPSEDRIETTLVDGTITIKFRDKDPVDVSPGQQIVYFSKKNEAIIKSVVPETYTSWKENKLRFIDTPFEEVLRKLGRRYNVVFEVRNTDLLDLRYTATFIDESIEEVMQMLKTISPISYRIYNRTTVNDSRYLKPKIIVSKRIQ